MVSLSVTHVVGSLSPSAGGPSRTVTQLCDSLALHRNIDISLLSQSRIGDPTVTTSVEQVNYTVVRSNSIMALNCGIPVWRALSQIDRHRTATLIHNHGIWLPVNHWAACAARRHKIPLIIQPRGMLEPWALGHNTFKKHLAMALFQRNDLESARLLIATADSEYESIRHIGLRQPVAVIPNGVQFDANPRIDNSRIYTPDFGRTVLFLSRIHPKKGLLNLLQAWRIVAPSGWFLKIAGPDDGGHLAEVLATIKQLGIEATVEYIGEIDGTKKSYAYRNADLFVLPTFSENFGVVVAEALAHGVPVITTRGAPWADLATYKCGWWVDSGVDPLVFALREAMALSDSERQAMGERGREYVKRYDWNDIAKQMIDVYRWIAGHAPLPDCVRTE